ncbi:MAG: undecaprenyl-diphosphate phosphatase [Gammaproteobacteria bacterium]|nr:undecaprenyl-diphosphate phosphatase [Gammaproteobacteria bacterium]MCH1551371.1 undecaprenyl-diphosphate phosphatase [Pseudomonadales bacterium]
MDWLQIIALSLIQGLTEFLPVSSSAHLVLPAQLTDWPDQGLAFDVGVHFGTLIAVVIYFRVELTGMSRALINFPAQQAYTPEIDLAFKLAAATLPVVIAGWLGKTLIEDHLRTVPVIASTTLLFGAALWIADRRPGTKERPEWSSAILIGLAQTLALIPGTSRSGITITAALMLGLSRTSAAKFSFLLSIPAIAGAQLLLTLDLINGDVDRAWRDLVSGALIAGLSAYLCIHYFIALVERTGMLPYVIYRGLLGAILLIIYFL